MYVDDRASGGTKEEVERFKGEIIEGKYTGTIQQILNFGEFKIKSIVESGCTDRSAMELLGSSALGYEWDATKDGMHVKIKVNLSKKKKKITQHPDLTLADFDKLRKIKLTKRKFCCWSVCPPSPC